MSYTGLVERFVETLSEATGCGTDNCKTCRGFAEQMARDAIEALTRPVDVEAVALAQRNLIDRIISAYHTTRLSETPVAYHVLSKHSVEEAFTALAAMEAPHADT